jgi:hypothetical protein
MPLIHLIVTIVAKYLNNVEVTPDELGHEDAICNPKIDVIRFSLASVLFERVAERRAILRTQGQREA